MDPVAFSKAKTAPSTGRQRMRQNSHSPAAAGFPPPSPVDVRAMVRRKEHLQRYATENKHSVDQLATRLMLSPRRIEELLAGHAPISNELATHIEEMLQLPASWLDDGGSLVQGVHRMIDAVERPMSATQDAQTPQAGDKKQVHEHRRLNLTMLTAERGAKNRLAQLAGTSGSRISLMTSARKPVSDPFAVAIEDGLGLPRGWLDQLRTASEVPAAVWLALGAEGSSEPAGQAPTPSPAPTTSQRTTQTAGALQPAARVSTPAPTAAPAPLPSSPLPPSKAAPTAELASSTGLFNKTAGQCGPIAEALAKTIINLSATDKLSESQAFQLLGQVIAASNPKG